MSLILLLDPLTATPGGTTTPVITATSVTAADYTGVLQALLPHGRVWPDDPASIQAQILGALAETPARYDAVVAGLLAGSLPGDYVDLIPEWEETLGLPDPCGGVDPSIAARAAQVRARFIGGGGQSLPFFVAFALALGFTVEIETFISFRPDISCVETPLYGDEWTFAWGVKILAQTGTVTAAVLLCELNSLKPAHTTVFIDS